MDPRSTPIAACALLALLVCLPVSLAAAADADADVTVNASANASANATANATAAATQITPGFREALSDFLISQNTVEVVQDQVTYSMSQYTLAALVSNGVEITEPMQEIVIDVARSTLGSRFGDIQMLTDLYAPLYSELLTEEELRELAKFWGSPLGKKTMELLPRLSESSYAILQEASQPYIAEFQTTVDKRFQEAGITPTPAPTPAPEPAP